MKLPKGIKDETAAAMMLKGMTVRYLLRATYKLKRGEFAVFHAAAGGVGSIFGQWAKAIGAKVIGTVGSPEKVAAAKANGYAYVIDTSKEDVVARVKEITKGKGVAVVYDAIRQRHTANFTGLLAATRAFGFIRQCFWCNYRF